jgi:hypothetical protein
MTRRLTDASRSHSYKGLAERNPIFLLSLERAKVLKNQ